MNCCCENCGWSEIIGSPIMCNYSGCRTWRDECCEAWKPKEETDKKNMVNIVRCKDCIYGDVPKLVYRKDDIYCARYEIFHNRDFYCADGMMKEGDGDG